MVQQGSEWSVGDALGGAWADATVLRMMLGHRLLRFRKVPHVTLPVVPGGSFTVLRFGEADLPDVVYIAQLTSAFYLEKR
jgi:hypothetical protein